MGVAVYARVSTTRQAQAQTIEQQLDRLVAAVTERGWTLDERHVYRDDGYSGAGLSRPGLDCLRDHAALAEVDLVVVTAPDRLARNYVHQVLLLDELGRNGCQVEFLDRPMSQDPHDQLLLQIRGAVAEYERTLIAERMRRGRQAKLRAGTLLPWTTPPFGYRLDPERPRDVAGVRVERAEAVLVAQLFDWYLEPQATVYRLAKRLTDLHVATPTGKPCWNAASVRGILRNPAYAGRALINRTRVVPARRRKSALLPVGPRATATPHARRRTGSRCRSRRSSPRRPSPGCRPSWTPTSRPRRATPATTTCCGRWSAAGGVGCRPPCAGPRPATTITCAAGAPTRSGWPRASAAALATRLPSSWTSWSGPTCARCSPIPRRSPVRWSGGGVGRGCPKSSKPAGRPSTRPWASWSANSSGCWTPTWPRCSRSPSSTASGRSWTAAGPRWPPSSSSWTPSPSSGWSYALSPMGSRHSARPSGRGWPPRPSPSGGCWSSCSSTGWS
jgi:DNA invertase Pin-like site-specific DNA recombinase